MVNVNIPALHVAAEGVSDSAKTMFAEVQLNSPAMMDPLPAGTDPASVLASSSFAAFSTEYISTANETVDRLLQFAVEIERAAVNYVRTDEMNALLVSSPFLPLG